MQGGGNEGACLRDTMFCRGGSEGFSNGGGDPQGLTKTDFGGNGGHAMNRSKKKHNRLKKEREKAFLSRQPK